MRRKGTDQPSARSVDRTHPTLALVCLALVATAGCERPACDGGDGGPCPACDASARDCGSAPLECGDGGEVDARSGESVHPLDLENDEDNTYAWRRIRGSLDPEEEVVYYWTGYIYAQLPPDPADFATPGAPRFESPLFRFEGYNVARFVEEPGGGYTMLSREASFYEDPRSGEILDCWTNTLSSPATDVRVVHVWNDPVNFGVGPVNFTEHGDRLIFFSDVFLAYRSPLAGDERHAPYSAGDVYQGAEMFNFYVSRRDLQNEALAVVPVEISWTRVGQLLPWMQMGDTPGRLVYAARGWKLEGGYDELPERIRAFVTAQGMEQYQHAPSALPAGYTPNGTSWRYFADLFDDGAYDPNCD